MIRQNTMTKDEIKAALIGRGIQSFKNQAGFIPQRLQEQWPAGSNVKDTGMYFTVATIRAAIRTMAFGHESTIVVEGNLCYITLSEHNIRIEEGDIPF